MIYYSCVCYSEANDLTLSCLFIHHHLHRHEDALMMEAERTSETPVYFYATTRRHIPEGCYRNSVLSL
jgi:hypothetical protein